MPAREPPAPAFWRNPLVVMLAALLLCLPALRNGQPFFYPDTASYVRGADMGFTKLLGPAWRTEWAVQTPAELAEAGAAKAEAVARMPRLSSMEEHLVVAGRSVYYGALVYVAYLASQLWLAVALQALAAAYMLHLLMVRLWSLGAPVFLGTVGLLALLTPLGAFAGLLMPDVFAPLIVLASGALAVYWSRLGWRDRLALAAIACFGLVGHPSHLALGTALVLALGAARLSSRGARRLSAPGLAMAAGCPQSGYAACAYADNFPTSWTAFLFSVDRQTGAFALADTAAKRQMSAERLPFFLDVIRFDPLGTARGLGGDILRQLTMFEVDTLEYGREAPRYAARLPAATFETLGASRAAQDSSANELLSSATQATVLAALCLALALAVQRRRQPASAGHADAAAWNDFTCFAAVAVAGVLCNAVVCVTLAAPFDRFQARIVWLIPFLALGALALTRERAATSPRPAVAALGTGGMQLVSVDKAGNASDG